MRNDECAPPSDELNNEIILTPQDVAKLCTCSVREAFQKMRDAGAVPFGRSLRISKAKFMSWIDSGGRASKVRTSARPKGEFVLDELLPDSLEMRNRRNASGKAPGIRSADEVRPIRHTQPRRRKVVEPQAQNERVKR